jgi:integrase
MNVGRKRKTHKDLPRRVYFHHGAYFFVDRDNKWHKLGRNKAEAYRAYAEFFTDDVPLRTLGEIFDRYKREILPTYPDKTQKNKARHFELLAAGFSDLTPGELRPHHIYSFRDRVARKYPTLANRTLETLSHTFTKAIEWGVAERNPCRDVRSLELPKRDRYVTDSEFSEIHKYCSPMLQCAMDLALLTGLRRGDLLALTRDNLTDDGILIKPSKTEKSSGKELLIEWSDELRAVTKRALSIAPQVRRFLIANRQGKGYTGDGFRNVWETARAKAL